MSYLGPKVYIDLHQLKKNYQIVKSEVERFLSWLQ